jgi:hypothetical protein
MGMSFKVVRHKSVFVSTAKTFAKHGDIAADLFYTAPANLLTIIRANSRLREIGLGPLTQGAMIKRSVWAAARGSLFQTAIIELEIAEPLSPRR